MTTKWQPAMKSAISEVLETMFFVLIEFVAPRSNSPSWYCGSKIQLFNDSRKIDISFRVTEPFARMITANFLSKNEEEVAQEEMEDVVKELANMVGGNYMSRIENEGWQLGIPRFEISQEANGGGLEGMQLFYRGTGVGVVDFESPPRNEL